MSKINYLSQYTELQATNTALWVNPKTPLESLLQCELRKINWLIEEADEDDIKKEIKYAAKAKKL